MHVNEYENVEENSLCCLEERNKNKDSRDGINGEKDKEDEEKEKKKSIGTTKTNPCGWSPSYTNLEARILGESGDDRRAYACRDFLPGQVIFRNDPFTFVLNAERCSTCYRKASSPKSSLSPPPSPSPPTEIHGISVSLKRCSRCRKIWYCSRNCQILDFPLHRIECRDAEPLMGGNNGSDEKGNNDARLLVRTFLKCQLEKRKQNDQGDGEDDDGQRSVGGNSTLRCCYDASSDSIQCCVNHLFHLQASKMPLSYSEEMSVKAAFQALKRQPKILQTLRVLDIPSVSMKDGCERKEQFCDIENELKRLIRRFKINNFGIVDEMMHLQGSGVYPLAALLNHSCQPNCILRYTTRGTMEIVAAKHILKGDELNHSYVELVATRTSRKSQLFHTYAFDCRCQKCEEGTRVALPKDYKNMAYDQIVEWILEHYSRFDYSFDKKATKAITLQTSIELDSLLQPYPLEKNLKDQLNFLRKQVHHAMSLDDLEGELNCLTKGIDILMATSSTAMDPAVAGFRLETYQLQCQRLSSWIVAGNTDRALQDCRSVAALLCLAFFDIPNHPLLGLQLFTLGDLYEGVDQAEKATYVYKWAHRILSISQGESNMLVQLLNEKKLV